MSDSRSMQAYLKIDTKTHTSIIHSLIPTSNGKYLISAAYDQVIRVWDMTTFKETRKILGQIGPGQIGQVKGLALTPDDHYLVVNVNMSAEGEASHAVMRFYDLQNGNLKSVFEHGGSISSMDISKDGRLLVLGDIDRKVIEVFDFNDLSSGKNTSPVQSITQSLQPSGVRIFESEGDYQILSGNWDLHRNDHTLSVTSLKTQKVNEIRLPRLGAPQYFAISDRQIAVSGHHEKSIWILDHELKPIREIQSIPHPARLAYSPDNSRLLAGAKNSTHNDPIQCCIYDASTDYRMVTHYSGHDANAIAVAFLDDATAITAGGSNFDIHFWNALNGELHKSIDGCGQIIYATGWGENQRLGFGNQQAYKMDQNNFAPLQHIFDLSNFSIRSMSEADAPAFQRVVDHRETGSDSEQYLQIFPERGINLYLMPDDDCITYFKEPGWYYAEVFGFTPDGSVITGSRSGELRFYPSGDGFLKGPVYLNGHSDTIWDFAIQGDWLVSGGADQCLRLWYLPDLARATAENPIYPTLNLFISNNGEWVVWSQSGYYHASMRGDQHIGFHVSQGDNQEALFYPSDRFIKELFKPALIRAILETGSEQRGMAKCGTHMVTIESILPPVIELNSPARMSYDRPDAELQFEVRPASSAVKRIWILNNDQVAWKNDGEDISTGGQFKIPITLSSGENQIKILAESETAKSIPALAVWEYSPRSDAGWIVEPVSFGTPGIEQETDGTEATVNLLPESLTLNFGIARTPGQIIKIEVTRDGEPVWQHGGKPAARKGRYRVRVPVEAETHQVEVWDKSSESPRQLLELKVHQEPVIKTRVGRGTSRASQAAGMQTAEASQPAELPDLFVLAVGVSKIKNRYPEQDFDNLDYAHQDAEAIVRAFRTQEGKLYRKVKTRLLKNQGATKENVLAAIQWLKAEIQKRQTEKLAANNHLPDLAVIFLAGHGVDYNGEFYFWTHELDLANIAATGIRLMDLGTQITGLPTELIFLTDTCRSGMVGRDLIRNIDPEVLAKLLISINERAQYILSATERDTLSFEDSLYKHGYFTQGILDGFDSMPSVTALQLADYVQERVRELSDGDQIPTVRTYGEIYRRTIYHK
jgi:WD40 repeat protein